eukprot:TRINITY_DN16778_c0_g2_i1.p2 TRINITY_DN16778_c0_g2~~TRINITY_DN16778_c0_g2_i1.p2  ORF type:complete len:123 (+),score=21.76 TRINITY_DN16778_c0_g2_i1:177-545(+)
MASRLGDSVWVCSCHPGVVSSGLQRGYKGAQADTQAWADGRTGVPKLLRWLRKSVFALAEAAPEDGAQTQLWAMGAPEALYHKSGSYFVPLCKPSSLGHPRAGAELQGKLRNWTTKMIESKE